MVFQVETRHFIHAGVEWTARRQDGVWVGMVAPGDPIPFPPPPGIEFVSAGGETRFLRLDYTEGLPKSEDFPEIAEGQLVEWLIRATLGA